MHDISRPRGDTHNGTPSRTRTLTRGRVRKEVCTKLRSQGNIQHSHICKAVRINYRAMSVPCYVHVPKPSLRIVVHQMAIKVSRCCVDRHREVALAADICVRKEVCTKLQLQGNIHQSHLQSSAHQLLSHVCTVVCACAKAKSASCGTSNGNQSKPFLRG